MQIYDEKVSNVIRVVTSTRGAWRWQAAYRHATYAPHLCRDGRYVWRSEGRSDKFARTKGNINRGFFGYPRGSLHNHTAAHCVDDYGNLVFIV